jgi:hypothetical protein
MRGTLDGLSTTIMMVQARTITSCAPADVLAGWMVPGERPGFASATERQPVPSALPGATRVAAVRRRDSVATSPGPTAPSARQCSHTVGWRHIKVAARDNGESRVLTASRVTGARHPATFCGTFAVSTAGSPDGGHKLGTNCPVRAGFHGDPMSRDATRVLAPKRQNPRNLGRFARHSRV